MTHAQLRPIRDLLDLMDDRGIPWSLERGGKHHKLVVAGRLCTIIPKSAPGSVTKNAVAARLFIRRRLNELGVKDR